MTTDVVVGASDAGVAPVRSRSGAGGIVAASMLADATRRGRTGQLALLGALSAVVVSVVLATAAGVHRTATVRSAAGDAASGGAPLDSPRDGQDAERRRARRRVGGLARSTRCGRGHGPRAEGRMKTEPARRRRQWQP